MIRLFRHINAEDVLILLLLDVVIANNRLNFGLVELFLEHLLRGDGRFPVILKVSMVWSHDLTEWFLDSSKLRLYYILARGNLSSDATSRRCRVAPVKLFFTLPSGDVPV